MGRLVTYSDQVDNDLHVIFKSKKPHVGLIIGQCTSPKDFIIRLCPTPNQEGASLTDEQLLEGEVKKSQKKGKKDKKPSVTETDIDLDEQWICQHAKQVTRMLPGGLDVLGVYVASTPELFNSLQSKFRQILFAVYKTLSKGLKFCMNDHINDRILLHICTLSFKVVCQAYDVSDYKSFATRCELKPFTCVHRWHKLESHLAVDLKFPVKRANSSFGLRKQIEMGLAPFIKDIKNAVTLINGTIRKPQESLDTSLDAKKSKNKEKRPQDQLCCKVDLYLPLNDNENGEDAELLDCIMMMTFKGTVECRAFVHSRATVGEAIQALKQDVIRTIIARCEIHCEDLLLIDGEQQDPVIVHELPRRVFAPLPQCDICVSDYQFHGDSACDSLDAFKELLNLELTEEDVDISCEKCPTTSALIQTEVMEDRLSEFGDAPASNHSTVFQVAGATLAVLAAGISYLLLLQDN